MAAIEGFTDVQNAALQDVTVGSLLFVQKAIAPANYDEDEDDEEQDEGVFGLGEIGRGGATASNDSGSTHNGYTVTLATQPAHANTLDGSRHPELEVDSIATDADTSNANATAQIEATSNDVNEPPETETFTPTMYIITSVIKSDDTGNITELGIAPLSFNHKVGSVHGDHSYHIFGNECKAYHDCEGPCEDVTGITTVATGEHFTFMVNPGGDYVRRIVHGSRRCIGTCKDGFLDNTSCLSDMVKDYVLEMLDYEQNVASVPACLQKPICPVCIGPTLLREQQALQQGLMANSVIDISAVVEYLGKLNLRRGVIRSIMGGYRFVQFDERQWGYGFDDMLEDEDDNDDGGGADDSGQFEHWDEAQDPNANPKLRPASDETIAALPRKQRSAITFEGDDETCCVDREAFESDSMLVQLPCGHAKFHEGCIVTWLKQYNNCPICREVIPDVNTEKEEKGPNHKAAMLRMNLGEALTSLGFEANTDFQDVDEEILPMIYGSAREDRAGWRTETAIARLEAERAMQKAATDDVEESGGGDSALGDEFKEQMEVPVEVGTWSQDSIMSDE